MGTEYYVFDKAHKRIFSLDKGDWSTFVLVGHVAGQTLELPLVREQLVRSWNWFRDASTSITYQDPWINRVANKLWAFCQTAGWQVELRWDSKWYDDEYLGDDDDDHWWPPTVSSRFDDDQDLDPDPCAEEQARWELVASQQNPAPGETPS